MANLTFIPNAKSKGFDPGLTLDDIPEEVRKDAEETYAALKTQSGRVSAKFSTAAELVTYETQIKAYCRLRPAGELYFRRSPSRGLPSTEMQFRITDFKSTGDEAAQGIRESVEEVKDAAKGTTTRSRTAK